MRHQSISFIFVLPFLMAGCNAARPPAAAVSAPMGPATANLPAGSNCASAISKYRSVMNNDLSMGHVNKSVYTQIMGEISQAETACAAGEDARAISLVRTSKSKHGYPS